MNQRTPKAQGVRKSNLEDIWKEVIYDGIQQMAPHVWLHISVDFWAPGEEVSNRQLMGFMRPTGRRQRVCHVSKQHHPALKEKWALSNGAEGSKLREQDQEGTTCKGTKLFQ